MKRTLVSLSGLFLAVLALGLDAGAVSTAVTAGHAQHGVSAHVQLAEGKSPTVAPLTVVPAE